MPLDHLIDDALSGDKRALSRLATHIENVQDRQTLDRLYSARVTAHIVGLTGPPGSGKSSLTGALAAAAVAAGKSIAVIAVDPSSPRTGGATLGDRVRMSEISTNPNVFVRSVASRGRRDGLSPSIAPMIQLFSSAGFDLVVVETVGAGQDQFEIANLVDTLVLAESPGSGDSVQMLKAGVMELADIYVVTKSDLDGSRALARDMRATLNLGILPENAWRPPVVLCSSETGEGILDVLEAIENHWNDQRRSGYLPDHRRRRALSEIRTELQLLAHELLSRSDETDLDSLVAEVANRKVSPRDAAIKLLRQSARDQAK